MKEFTNRLSYYIDSLNRFIKSEQPLILVIGQDHTKKNELITEFIQQLPKHYSLLTITGNQQYSTHQFIQCLSDQWELEIDPLQISQRQQLDQLLAQLGQAKSQKLLIVNDAHTLSLSTLAAISHLAARQEAGKITLSIFAIGEVDLADKMASLMAQVPPSLLLQPLTKKETAQYIRTRLAKLGKTNPILPSQAVIDDIHEKSCGFPSLINHLSQQWLYQHILGEDELNHPTTDNSSSHKTSRPKNESSVKSHWDKYGVKLISLIGFAVAAIALWIMNHKPAEKPNLVETAVPAAKSISGNSKTPEANLDSNKSYAIQIFADRNLNTCQNFIASHALQKEAEIHQISSRGIIWHIVTIGHFSNSNQAAQHIAYLPSLLQKTNPWVRKINTIKEI